MHGGRRDSEVLLHFGFRWRTSVDFAVVMNESQILTLFARVSFLHSHCKISQNSNRLSRGIRESCKGATDEEVPARALEGKRVRRTADHDFGDLVCARAFDTSVPWRCFTVDGQRHHLVGNAMRWTIGSQLILRRTVCASFRWCSSKL